MTVDCVMPTLNQREFIEAAVDSIKGQVDGLAIVNDGSTDGTREWLERGLSLSGFGHVVTWSQNNNRGTAWAINKGVELLGPRTAEWLTWVSSDNVMHPDWIETLLRYAGPTVGVVYGGFDIVSSGGGKQYAFTPYNRDKLISNPTCYFGPAFIIRADVWQPHRGRISHDYDNWLRVEEACWDQGLTIVGVDKSLCDYNAHDKRATVTRRHEFDANRWQAEAQARRK